MDEITLQLEANGLVETHREAVALHRGSYPLRIRSGQIEGSQIFAWLISLFLKFKF